MSTYLRPWLGAVGLLLFVWAALYGTQEVVFRRTLDERLSSQREALSRHEAAFLADREWVASLPWLASPTRERDAGTFFNGAIEWTAPEDRKSLAQPAAAPLAISEELSTRLDGWKHAELDHFREVDFRGLDFRWMKELERYDHWDLQHGSPLEIFFRGELAAGRMAPMEIVLAQPTPRFKTLLQWARLRWMRAAGDGTYLAASRETRDLARLVLSTETFVASLVAVAILRLEAEIHAAASGKRWKIPSGWQPVEIETTDRLTRFLEGSVAFFTPLASPETLKRAFLEGPFVAMACGSVLEGIQLQAGSRASLSHGFPGERQFRASYAQLDRIVSFYRENCRLPHAEALWRDGQFGAFGSGTMMRFIPYVRTLAGGTLLALAGPNFLGRYREIASTAP